MGYYVGDIPATDIILEPSRNGEYIDLTKFTGADVQLRNYAGTLVTTTAWVTSIVGDELRIKWPGTTAFPEPGLFTLHITLKNTTLNTRERIAPYQYVVQADDGWHNLDTARDQWENAPESDLKLFAILFAAKQEITAYAPPLATATTRPPLNYLQAQIMQARNIWNAAKVDPATGGLGEDTFIVRPFPLDWMIIQILRPKTGIPRVG